MGDIRIQLLTYLNGIWRRRWFAIVIAWLVCVAGWIAVLTLPNQYRSEARIYVDAASLGPLLKGIAVNQNVDEKVGIMTRTLLSRPNLEQVARMTDLDVTVTTPGELEGLLGRLENSTEIKGQGRNLFLVSFQDRDPVLAREVVQALLTIFVENNLGEDREEMATARSFIDDQIAVYEGQLRSAEMRLAQFKQENGHILSAKGNFAARLEDSRSNLAQMKLSYDDAIARRNQLQTQLKEVPQFLEIDSTAPQIILGGGGTPASLLLGRIEEMQQNLDNLLLKFTDRHPDVIATQRTLDRLMAQYEKEQAAAESGESDSPLTPSRPKTKLPNPLYDEVKLKLVDNEAEVITLRRRLGQAEAQVAKLEALTQTAPQVEARLADLDRDYGVIKRKYEDLLQRREAGRLAEAVQAKSDPIQFRVVDPPQVPTSPSAPNRKLFMFVVLVAGLGAGVGFVFLLSQIDESFSAPEDLKRTFGIPVLGSVSVLVSRAQQHRRVFGLLGFGAVCLGLFGVFGVLLTLLPQLGNLSQLAADINLPDFVKGFI